MPTSQTMLVASSDLHYGISRLVLNPHLSIGNIPLLPEKFKLLKYVLAVVGCLWLSVQVHRKHTAPP